jgi:hypothetical protein
MGCGGSKEEANPNEIKHEMKKTQVPELDEFFNTASGFLEGLEGLRAGFEDTRDEMNELGRTDELVAPSLLEAIKVFFWSCSAHKDGNIKASGVTFTSDPPAFTINCQNMDFKTYDFSAAMHDLIGGIVGAPKQIADLGSQAKEIGEKAVELQKDVKAKIDASGLNPLEKGKAGAYAASNFATVLNGCKKAPNVFKQATDACADIKGILPKIKTLLDEADVIGKEASGKNIKKMDEIFDHYQKAQKKTPEQIKTEHKGKKPKKAGKKKAKKEHGGEHKKEEHKGEQKGEHKAEHKAEGHH